MRVLVLVLLLAAAAQRAAADDASALSLADKTLTPTTTVRDWRVFVEAAWDHSAPRDDAETHDDTRLFLDVRYDKTIAPGWRAVFADLLDVNWQNSFSHQNTINTVIDAYASWHLESDRIVDAGRINTRYGVGVGYNPTDYFRANAIRSIVSIDPASLREKRLGSVMVRGQALWPAGSLTALYSPKLGDRANDSAFNPDFGATNFRDRWLLAASHELTHNVNPQLLLYGEAGRAPRVGLNFSALVNDKTVAYVEYSGGRTPSLFSQALTSPADTAFRSQFAAGFTYTTARNFTLSLEYEYNGAGLDQAGWDALRSGAPVAYAQYRAFTANVQEQPTTRKLFANARWQDALVNHLDLSAFAYYNFLDSSRQHWIEARYHWTRVDVALQWQVNSGAPGSEYGALPARNTWQALVKYFF